MCANKGEKTLVFVIDAAGGDDDYASARVRAPATIALATLTLMPIGLVVSGYDDGDGDAAAACGQSATHLLARARALKQT